MKKAIITVLMIMVILIVVAQEPVDTLALQQQLQEVVIEAPKVVRKSDMDLYYPSKSAVDNSKNGVQLLNNLMIP